MELYKKYRPSGLDEVYGQADAIKMLTGWVSENNIPHAIMLDGPTGVGKSTIARILASVLGASDPAHLREINVSSDRGLDMVGLITEDLQGNIFGGNRVWVLEEAQGITKQGQGALLQLIEDLPDYAYFIFCTMEPQKIITALKGRCAQLHLKRIPSFAMSNILQSALQREGKTLDSKILMQIVKKADGSARRALMLLEECLAVSDTDQMLSIINTEESLIVGGDYKDFWSTLFRRRNVPWNVVVAEFSELTDDPETIRRATLRALGTMLIRDGSAGLDTDTLAEFMGIFKDSLVDSGQDGLLLMVYQSWRMLRNIR